MWPEAAKWYGPSGQVVIVSRCVTLTLMTISDVFLQLGEERLRQLVRGISIGKLRTYQLYERFKIRTHLAKLNTENLRAAVPRFWQRLNCTGH